MENCLFFETIKINSGQIFLWKYHKQRIEENIVIFDLKINANGLIENILKVSSNRIEKCIIKFYTNYIEYKIEPFEDNNQYLKAKIFDKSIEGIYRNVKLGDRIFYNESLLFAKKNKCDISIIIDENKNIVESNISNILINIEDKWITPPLSSGCINGVYRRFILDTNIIKVFEKEISINDLQKAKNILSINSLRGIKKIVLY